MTVARNWFGLMAALLFRCGNSSGGLDAQRRRGVKSSLAAEVTGGGSSTWSWNARAAHDGLTGTNGPPVNRLAWYRSRTAGRHAGTRRGRLRLPGYGAGLLQARHHVRTRWNHWAHSRLPREIRAAGSSQWHGW